MISVLDYFTRCAVDGCPWIVWHTARACADHGGPRVPQYAQAADGDLLDSRYTPAQQDPAREALA